MTGDTKVVEKGKGDGVFIATTGIGLVPPHVVGPRAIARPGDVVLVSGTLGDHGVAILQPRRPELRDLDHERPRRSTGSWLAWWRWPGRPCPSATRRAAALAATLNEIAHQSGVGMSSTRRRSPSGTRSPPRASSLVLIRFSSRTRASSSRSSRRRTPAPCSPAMHADPLGRDARVIGHVVEDEHRFIQLDTAFGRRLLDWLTGEALPRIC